MLSIIIPLRDEFDNLEKVRDKLNEKLSDINHEVLLINDFSKLYEYLDENSEIKKKFKKNQKLIDFNFIPKKYVNKFNSKFKKLVVKIST